MPDLLFLCQRVPYPPNRGDRIRSWHMLRHLARRHRVHLGCLLGDPADRRWTDALSQVCAETHVAEPSGGLARWVEQILAARRPTHAFAVSAPMASYVPTDAAPLRRRVVDMVHVESERCRQSAARRPWPLSLAQRRAARRLLDLERNTASRFDASLFASAREAALFRRLAPESAGRVAHVGDGVDADYFAPTRDYPNPFPNDRKAIVFAGATEEWPSLDAAQWFVRDVLPGLRARRLQVGFWIVGGGLPALRRLADPPQVMLTGAVDDVRPYLAHAAVVVAPLRHAGGAPGMVLEAMAMARPVVATPQALEGLDVEPGRDVAQAADAGGFGLALAAALAGRGAEAMGARGRARVVAAHGWAASLDRLDAVLDG